MSLRGLFGYGLGVGVGALLIVTANASLRFRDPGPPSPYLLQATWPFATGCLSLRAFQNTKAISSEVVCWRKDEWLRYDTTVLLNPTIGDATFTWSAVLPTVCLEGDLREDYRSSTSRWFVGWICHNRTWERVQLIRLENTATNAAPAEPEKSSLGGRGWPAQQAAPRGVCSWCGEEMDGVWWDIYFPPDEHIWASELAKKTGALYDPQEYRIVCPESDVHYDSAGTRIYRQDVVASYKLDLCLRHGDTRVLESKLPEKGFKCPQ